MKKQTTQQKYFITTLILLIIIATALTIFLTSTDEHTITFQATVQSDVINPDNPEESTSPLRGSVVIIDKQEFSQLLQNAKITEKDMDTRIHHGINLTKKANHTRYELEDGIATHTTTDDTILICQPGTREVSFFGLYSVTKHNQCGTKLPSFSLPCTPIRVEGDAKIQYTVGVHQRSPFSSGPNHEVLDSDIFESHITQFSDRIKDENPEHICISRDYQATHSWGLFKGQNNVRTFEISNREIIAETFSETINKSLNSHERRHVEELTKSVQENIEYRRPQVSSTGSFSRSANNQLFVAGTRDSLECNLQNCPVELMSYKHEIFSLLDVPCYEFQDEELCILEQAVIQEDPSLCEEREFPNTCYRSLASTYEDEEYCYLIDPPNYQRPCLLNFYEPEELPTPTR